MVFVETLSTSITKVLFHLVDFPHVLPQTVLVGESCFTLIALNFLVSGLQSFMINLFVSLEVSVPGEIFITEITLERSLAGVSQHVSVEPTWSGECFVAARLGTSVQVDAATARREMDFSTTRTLRVGLGLHY